MQNQRQTLVILLLDRHATAFVRDAQSTWCHQGLHGEAWYLLRTDANLRDVLGELDARMNLSDGLARFTLHLLYDQASLPCLANVADAMNDVHCKNWQVLQWETLRDRAALLGGSSPEGLLPSLDWLQQGLLPVLEASFSYLGERLVAERSHADTVAVLNAERMRLEAEIALQRQQLAAVLRGPALEDLVTYLPALYRNVFSSIAPHDLALLANSLEVPKISSPWPEPALDTLYALQTRLRKLPERRARQLRDFCRELPHKVELRSEMRNWMEQD
jgi:hypothetical protein